ARSFAAFIRRKGADEATTQTAAAIVAALQDGEIAVPLQRLRADDIYLPAASDFIGAPGEHKPFILEHDLIYLYRYWQYETDLAERLQMLAARRPVVDIGLLKAGLEREFPGAAPDDRQRMAAAAAVVSRFCVISGGPGTGKTTTVRKIISLLQEQAAGGEFRVLLAAPTGKAAGRLKQVLLADEAGEGALSGRVATLHRLLGYIPDSARFRHNGDNPLPCELLIVDEASMIPLPMMAKLVAALPVTARLVLLGDRDQLASVEPGAVFGDICQASVTDCFTIENSSIDVCNSTTTSCLPGVATCLSDAVIRLERSYRFSESGGIGRLSRLVRQGDAAAAVKLVARGDDEVSNLSPMPGRSGDDPSATAVLAGYLPFLQEKDPAAALQKLEQFRILCAVRNGERGVDGANRRVEAILASAGAITPDNRWYAGRPVMVTVNDYGLRLYNGDVGLVMADPDDGSLAVFFPDDAGGVRRVAPPRLPAHETAYAITVHKSQGSEFDRVLLLLPSVESQVVTSELIYTGITRAKRAVIVSASLELLAAGIERRVTRSSGLARRLWGDNATQN
ncbi:MAG: exodeoxyribonuclease V subunit alpha, partial [Geobacter sp.]|nr:exodeoxyribonuclease V subunit alpha [Geobacter sp.]